MPSISSMLCASSGRSVAGFVGHEVFQVGQPLGHGFDLCMRNGLGLGQEGIGQRVADDLDVRFLRACP